MCCHGVGSHELVQMRADHPGERVVLAGVGRDHHGDDAQPRLSGFLEGEDGDGVGSWPPPALQQQLRVVQEPAGVLRSRDREVAEGVKVRYWHCLTHDR
jgi:hypothetical protein